MVIALVASLIRNPFINRLVSVTAWTIAALSILGLLDDTVAALDARAILIGGIRVTPLLVLKTAVLLAVALWAATATSNFLDRRVQHVSGLTPSIQVLLGKLIRIGVMTVAIVIVLSAAGIDLSVLAVFTGAIGVGVGLGLQKIVSNFVSGIILLADKSIKPGDVITVGDHFGWVANMGARYTSVDLKDGRELLVPNEDLVTQRVINWTYSSDLMRLEVKFSTTYDSDLHKTRAVAVAGGAERRAGAEGAAAGLPPDRIRRERDRIRAVVLDQGRRDRPDRRALRRDDRAVGHVRARGHQAADPRRDAGHCRAAEVTAGHSGTRRHASRSRTGIHTPQHSSYGTGVTDSGSRANARVRNERGSSTRGRALFIERFIHGEIYKARPDVNSVIHTHSAGVIPFSVTRRRAAGVPQRFVSACRRSGLGNPGGFGTTTMLVNDGKLGQSLAARSATSRSR